MTSDSFRAAAASSTKTHLLLTGATGLLGRYLLRNMLSRHVPVAVLTRGNRLADANARIDKLIEEIEAELGRRLPRPVVLPGDLGRPGLGMPKDALDWIEAHVGAIMHNAASLSFQNGERHEDPWRTNVTGTQSILELAERSRIRQFHHVSTAYVCGLRTGRILESERNLGQAFGNDYERSKIEAEEMVSAHGFDSLTIYRPAIIVGDSRTGFTSTYHGFYTPLHIVHTMINKVSFQDIDMTSLTGILDLKGSERKNLVPVDWVAAVISHLALDKRRHGLTYHITPDEATSVSTLSEVFSEAIATLSIDWDRALRKQPAQQNHTVELFVQSFRTQMMTYKAYWRDDPVFDATNTRNQAPHLPPPALDRQTLLMLCRFAIERNFWSSPVVGAPPDFDVPSFLRSRTRGAADPLSRKLEASLNLSVSGPGGGQWRLRFDGQRRLCDVVSGHGEGGAADVITTVDCLRAVQAGQADFDGLLRGGGMALEKVLVHSSELYALLQSAFAGPTVSPN